MEEGEIGDNRFPWQKGINLLTFNDKSDMFNIYPENYHKMDFINTSYVNRVDLIILRMGIR